MKGQKFKLRKRVVPYDVFRFFNSPSPAPPGEKKDSGKLHPIRFVYCHRENIPAIAVYVYGEKVYKPAW